MSEGVLLVDDEEGIRELAPHILRFDGGYDVTAVATVGQAREIMERKVFDYHIIDGDVEREGDGLAFALELQAQGKFVVIWSGNLENFYEGVPVISKPSFHLVAELQKLKSGKL